MLLSTGEKPALGGYVLLWFCSHDTLGGRLGHRTASGLVLLAERGAARWVLGGCIHVPMRQSTHRPGLVKEGR